MSAGRLQGKSIVITGAASGLGRAMALAFAAEGADVVVGDVRPDPREGGDPTVDLIERAGGSGVFVAADASAGPTSTGWSRPPSSGAAGWT